MIKGIDEKKFRAVYLKGCYKATSRKTEPLANVELTLENLSKKTKFVLTTMRLVSAKQETTRLDTFSLTCHFQAIVTSVDVINAKLPPDAPIQGANKLEVEPSHCAVVGDSVVGTRAGKN